MPDALDRRIVNALQRDGRASIREVAEAVDAPATTVQERIRTLEDRGVIEGYTPRVDYGAVGYDLTAVFKLDVEGDALEAVLDRLRASERTIAAYEVTGTFDVIAIGKFADTESMNDEIKELLTYPGVRAGNTSIVLDVVREFDPLELDERED